MQKKEEIFHFIATENYIVYCFTETHVTACITDEEIEVDGYSLIRCNSSSRYTGGVLIYVHNLIITEVLCNLQIENSMWILGIKYKDIKQKVINLFCIYRSPSSCPANCIDRIADIGNNVEYKGLTVIVGDFNLNIKDKTFYADKLLKRMKEHGFKQHVKEYTRITRVSKTIIDLVFSNSENLKVAVKHTPRLSDHSLVEVEVIQHNALTKVYNPTDESLRRNFRNFCSLEFQNKLRDAKWTALPMNVNEASEELYVNINRALDETAPYIKSHSLKASSHAWYDAEIRKQAKNRDMLFKKAKLLNDVESWNIARIARNKTTQMIKNKRRDYFMRLIDTNRHDSKKMWKVLKETICVKKPDQPPSSMKFGGIKISDPTTMANNFNEYMIKSIHDILPQRQQTQPPKTREINHIFKFTKITSDEIKNAIVNMKHSSADDINGKITKAGGTILIEKLADIFNLSIQTGEFPKLWKNATIIPIKKLPNAQDPQDYRPINTLPFLEKVFENIIKKQLLRYISKADILIENQSGFRERYSCETSLQLVVSRWKNWLDKPNAVIVATFLDLKRAFETVNRSILLSKLYNMGIRGVEHKWMKSYLEERTQMAKIGGSFSVELKSSVGVPQGSVLGPLLFILYINDIKNAVLSDNEYCLNLFADDTLLAIEDYDIDRAVHRSNLVLGDLSKWLSENDLIVNENKCKVLYLGQKNKPVSGVRMNQMTLEVANVVKYLGIHIDDKLSFKAHILAVIDKITKRTSYFGRICRDVNMINRINVYKSIIAPHYQYCPTIWAYADAGDIQKIQIQQNRAMRYILRCNRYTPVKLMQDCLKFLSVKQYLVLQILCFIYKASNKLFPPYINKKLIKVSDIHQHETRNRNNFYVTKANKQITKRSIFHDGVVLYNSIPSNIRQVKRLGSFKQLVTEYIKDNF